VGRLYIFGNQHVHRLWTNAKPPEIADAHYNLANLLARQKKYERAVAQYQKAPTIETDRIQALNNPAFVYASMQEYEKAVTTLQQLARLQTDNSQIYLAVIAIKRRSSDERSDRHVGLPTPDYSGCHGRYL
jgi:tetratricopeptide (TPR) repeat protein